MNVICRTVYWFMAVLCSIPSLQCYSNLLEPAMPPHAPKCEEIKVPLCQGIGYTMTSMPNQLNHLSQDEAGLEAHQFYPLVAINCSADMRFFICSMYTPICLPDYTKPLPPCRSVCERARAGCAPLMLQYGFDWPDKLDCSLLPVFGAEDQLCMDSNQTDQQHQHSGGGGTAETHETPATPPIDQNSVKANWKISNKDPFADHSRDVFNGKTTGLSAGVDYSILGTSATNEDPRRPYSQHHGLLYGGGSMGAGCPCSCPNNDLYKVVEGDRGARMFIFNVSHCTYACHPAHLGDENRNLLTFWIGLWASLCFVSTFLTVATYLIDMDRFQYPERPIIFLSFCYLAVSIGYLVRLVAGHDFVACEGDRLRAATVGPLQCTLVFLLVYFFGVASSVWWVVLSFTWFLAAGLKWSNEAIASYWPYFHLIAWSVPAILSSTVLAMSAVDGDPYSGVCSVGNADVNALRAFQLAPLFCCLVLGSFFLFSGFVSLVRIHNIVKHQSSHGPSRIQKLEKLIARIGIFSVLYTVPATVVLGCYFYEQFYRKTWEGAGVCSPLCNTPGGVSPASALLSRMLPTSMFNTGGAKPEFSVFLLKYFMCLVVGFTSGIWIWSPKTVDSWKRAFGRMCGSHKGQYQRRYPTSGGASYSPAQAIIVKSHTDMSSSGAGACYSKHYPMMNHV